MKHIRFALFLCLVAQQLSPNPVPSGSALSIIGPVVITEPGNYCLANDISGTVTIAANNVCFDLKNKIINGTVNGIVAIGQSAVSIKNGGVQGASASGVFIDACTDVKIANMELVSNGTGVHIMTTTCAVVKLCECSGNGNHGIALTNSNSCRIKHNKALSNGTTFGHGGIFLSNNSVFNEITKNVCNSNREGIDLRLFSTHNVFTDNICNNNVTEGIHFLMFGDSNIVTRNTCSRNARGIFVDSADNVVSYNVAENNTDSGIIINAGPRNVVSNNTCIGNVVHGIATVVGTTGSCFVDNISNFNGTSGISNAATGNSFFRNKAQQNGAGASNFIGAPGVPPATIGIFSLAAGDFVSSPTLCCNINISVVP